MKLKAYCYELVLIKNQPSISLLLVNGASSSLGQVLNIRKKSTSPPLLNLLLTGFYVCIKYTTLFTLHSTKNN